MCDVNCGQPFLKRHLLRHRWLTLFVTSLVVEYFCDVITGRTILRQIVNGRIFYKTTFGRTMLHLSFRRRRRF